MISVIVPTIDGREEHLTRCLKAYESNTEEPIQLIVIKNKETCGIAWQEGAEQALGDYIHFTADDLEPWKGWDVRAREYVGKGWLPAPMIMRPNGTLESCGQWQTLEEDQSVTEMTRIPFMALYQWRDIGPMLPIHYYTDNYVSHRGRQNGWPTIVCHGYKFTHHWATIGRGAGMDEGSRMQHDYREYRKAIEDG